MSPPVSRDARERRLCEVAVWTGVRVELTPLLSVLLSSLSFVLVELLMVCPARWTRRAGTVSLASDLAF